LGHENLHPKPKTSSTTGGSSTRADKPLGRLATEVARVLRGKHKPIFTPHLDTGDHVVVVNAEQGPPDGSQGRSEDVLPALRLHGRREARPFQRMIATHPERVIEMAVKGMLPKNALGKNLGKKLKVYAGAEHPHQGQRPEPLDI
jgi:large subunit ribosomal protein L13